MFRLYQAGMRRKISCAAFGYAVVCISTPSTSASRRAARRPCSTRAVVSVAPRTRTPEREAQVIRAKALAPELGDTELGQRFGLDRATVYELLREHGIQDLHRVVTDQPAATATAEPGEKGGSKPSPVPTP